MTPYGEQDLEGFEFKIIRSANGRFKNPEFLRRTLEEEAHAGWEILEKFDDQRVRLKRRSDCRRQDSMLDFDAYRTWVGATPNQIALYAVLGMLVVGCVIGGVVLFLHA